MTKWLQWIVLTAITGSPLLSIVILLVFWYGVDQVAFGIFPSPRRLFNRFKRVGRLRATLANNPHDRRARAELADLLLQRRNYRQAAELLKANLKAGDDDTATLFNAGVALYGSGDHEEADRLLLRAREREPNFRMNSIDLELGRWRLGRNDVAGAAEALERFCKARPGTVEGKVLLAKALQKSADQTRAKETRAAAWQDYASAPWFRQKRDRLWAWRANPKRPAIYLTVVLALGIAFARWGAPMIAESTASLPADAYELEE